MSTAIVTDHAKQRTKERLGLSKTLTDKMANKALEYGVGHKDSRGRLNKYITKLYFNYQTANNIKVYNRKVYVFKGGILITIINLPNNLFELADKFQKEVSAKRIEIEE